MFGYYFPDQPGRIKISFVVKRLSLVEKLTKRYMHSNRFQLKENRFMLNACFGLILLSFIKVICVCPRGVFCLLYTDENASYISSSDKCHQPK